ncbi:MAG: NADH-quinone oxidoreductase subunit J [Coriobacteriia bacterium]|jgi:NADH-quinone oxidoreductase subunit J|nr:NADH-quinone oxidoreductase subunit J [Coriobacteriia bacterium]
MTETVNGVAFIILAFACIGGAVGMLTTRHVVHAAFWLLEVMVAVGGLYLLLSAEFLAVVQILVYAGAVSVLLLFVIMLTLRSREDAVRPVEISIGGGVLAAVFGVVMYVAIAQYGDHVAQMPAVVPDTAALGELLFSRWALPFEVASLVLLTALVGAVWWSREDDRP